MDRLESDDSASSQETCLKVLRYWHRLEFFVPFDLDSALSGKEHPLDISFQGLQDGRANSLLPWLNNKQKDYHYLIYLLPFDKNELTKLSTQFFPAVFQDQNPIDLEEKLADEGLTCFARITIDKYGSPMWKGISVSTMPWAMGMVQSGEFEQLTEVRYADDMILLKSALNVLENEYEKTKCEAYPKGHFNANLLAHLVAVLTKWARYSPEYPFAVKIKAVVVTERKAPIDGIKALTHNVPSTEGAARDKVGEEAPDDTLDILNSFYIPDLEKTIRSVINQKHPMVAAYINGSFNRRDVLSADFYPLLCEQLYPSHSTLGRWPAASHHKMSLMQQFCINQYFNSRPSQPILATSGPPGTGKTTLLKDIIAENLVRRARALSHCDSVQQCFVGRRKIVISGKDVTIHTLKAELTGFEMLVASSNNTAVENISRELPLKSNVAKQYQDCCHYLTPVAAKLSATHHNNQVLPLPPHIEPWGLIAVALGKLANRNEFVERFFFSPDTGKNAADRTQLGAYLNIWEWRQQYQGPRFNDAKADFLKCYTAVEEYQKRLQQFAELSIQIVADPWSKHISENEACLKGLEQELHALTLDKNKTENSLNILDGYKQELSLEMLQQLAFKPSLWERILRTEEARHFKAVIRTLQNSRLKLTTDYVELQEKRVQLSRQIVAKKEAIANKQGLNQRTLDERQAIHNQFQATRATFPDINLPKEIMTPQDQIQSYWQTQAYNNLRSELCIKALQLHEAWLAEALGQKYFGGNLYAISLLLSQGSPVSSEDELLIWQSLFMMIPVVSCTFASLGRQFKNLGSQSLGLLLIDEAGQAIPQAAVGALWRCKKAIVVGDPRQIEPIMTLPPHLIEGVAKHHFSSLLNPNWLPHVTSIQRLADSASLLGSWLQQGHQQEWGGIPLLVHRRCLEPMFSIANEIAYDGKMINAREAEEDSHLLGPQSVWFDVGGKASEKQYIPEQGEWALELFISFYNRDRKLPDLFIITPFRMLKKHISTLLQQTNRWIPHINPELPIATQGELLAWLGKHLGTVHTFQGKEAKKVLFILGADKEQQGAVNWACSKANLLNVALTRATDRIYIIGEWELWANRRYFSEASSKLKRVSPVLQKDADFCI